MTPAAKTRKSLDALRALVNEQAEDEALWAIPGAQTIEEAYLQQELRRLHAAVEACLDAQC